MRAFMIGQLSRAISTIVTAIRHATEGEPPAHERTTFDVDCTIHGKTFLVRTRQTACCGSMHWIPSGEVKSRIVDRTSRWSTQFPVVAGESNTDVC